MNPMAAGATMYVFEIELADMDRGVYEQFTLRASRHPSETDAYLLTRVLAYCLELEDGITFSDGISATADPAVLVRDLSGKLLAWIEVGAPDARAFTRAARRPSARRSTRTATRPGCWRSGRGRRYIAPRRSSCTALIPGSSIPRWAR